MQVYEDSDILRAVRERPDGVATLLTRLSALLLEAGTPDERLRSVVGLAVETVPGCDAAGLTLVDDGRPTRAVSTDTCVPVLDESEFEVGDGPCLDALSRGRVSRLDLTDPDHRWPAWRRAATAAGVGGLIAAPLLGHEEPLGWLNLYSRRPFDADDEAFANMLSSLATAVTAETLRFAEIRTLAGQLDASLVSRAVIEQAKGVLMSRLGVDADSAFAVLRRQSSYRNVKLHVVASETVASTRQAGT